MARNRKGSPRITLQITEADRVCAIESNSGACLIADALKRLGYTAVTVDMATIRFTDPKAGKRYTYLTPPAAQHCLLSFDQGWPVEGIVEIRLQRAVKIVPVTLSRPRAKSREERLQLLEAKEVDGTLTRQEKAGLTRMRHNPGKKPSTEGPVEVTPDGTVVGGTPIPQGPAHPNLLRGRNRIYGAKLADPGKAFQEAVQAALRDQQETGSLQGLAS
jgi:hypothetical protein